MSVQSIERAFVLLRTIAQYPDGITVTDLARRTGLHKSTVSRFITALEHENAIARVDNALFIGTGIADLLTDSLHTSTIAALARPYLELLAADFNETVGIGVPESGCVHYIDQVTANQVIQVRNWTGERFPYHTTSSGKVFLAFAPADDVERYLQEPLVAFTPRTLVEPDALRAQLVTIRAHGYDWSVEEFTDGLAVVSAPIFGSNGHPVASIYVCGPVFRFPAEAQGKDLLAALLDACAQVSQLLGRAMVRDGRATVPALAP